jgi:hypothetical protein
MICTRLAVSGSNGTGTAVRTSKTDLMRRSKNPGFASGLAALSGEGEGEFVVTMLRMSMGWKYPAYPARLDRIIVLKQRYR